MAISVFLAKTAADYDDAFRVRHDVYVDEEQRFAPRADARIYDRFDSFPETKIVVAVDRDRPELGAVGTVRFAIRGELGLPSDQFYDFSKALEGLQGAVGTLGMLAVRRRYRMTRGLVMNMVLVGWRDLRMLDTRHLVAPASPDAEPILVHMGAKSVGDPIFVGNPPVKMTPLYLDMMNLRPMFREVSLDPQHILFDDINERRLYRQNHRVINFGEWGNEAFLIMRGSVRVTSGLSASELYLLGPGELFGELALLDGGLQPLNVDVHSKLLDVAVIDRRQFKEKLSHDSEFSSRVLELLVQRVRRLLVDKPPEQIAQGHQEALLAEVLLEVSENGTKSVEKRWLAAEVGLRENELDQILEPWLQIGVVRREGDGAVEVEDPNMLTVIIDHVVDSMALAKEPRARSVANE